MATPGTHIGHLHPWQSVESLRLRGSVSSYRFFNSQALLDKSLKLHDSQKVVTRCLITRPIFLKTFLPGKRLKDTTFLKQECPTFLQDRLQHPPTFSKHFNFTVGYAYGSWSHSKSMSVQRLRGRQVLRSVLKNKRTTELLTQTIFHLFGSLTSRATGPWHCQPTGSTKC